MSGACCYSLSCLTLRHGVGLLAEEAELAANAEPAEGDEDPEDFPPETFSDLDDDEIDGCILTEEESVTKKTVWESTFKCVAPLTGISPALLCAGAGTC